MSQAVNQPSGTLSPFYTSLSSLSTLLENQGRGEAIDSERGAWDGTAFNMAVLLNS